MSLCLTRNPTLQLGWTESCSDAHDSIDDGIRSRNLSLRQAPADQATPLLHGQFNESSLCQQDLLCKRIEGKASLNDSKTSAVYTMISGLAHVNLLVPAGTLDKAEAFYGGTLGLTPRAVPELQKGTLAWYVCEKERKENDVTPC